MTLKSWFDEFMPIPASKAHKTDLEAIEHSLKKWQGLTKANLKKHGLELTIFNNICEIDNSNKKLVINCDSCALCLKHTRCHRTLNCSLQAVRENARACDEQTFSETISPWHAWGRNGDPKPMIRLLKKALAAMEGETK
jgi:hypothetical protein